MAQNIQELDNKDTLADKSSFEDRLESAKRMEQLSKELLAKVIMASERIKKENAVK